MPLQFSTAAVLRQVEEARRSGRVRQIRGWPPDPWLSVHDLLREWGSSTPPRDLRKKILPAHPGLRALLHEDQLPGKGQKPTPWIHRDHLGYLVEVWAGVSPVLVPRPIPFDSGQSLLHLPAPPPQPLTVLDGPYGWVKRGGEVLPVKEEQAVLRAIRKEMNFGTPMRDLLEELKKWPTRHGGPWTREHVESALAGDAEVRLEEE